MKKIACLVLAVLMFCSAMTVFALPAFAADSKTVEAGQEMIITGEEEYKSLSVYGNLFVKNGGVLTVSDLFTNKNCTITLEPGAVVKANDFYFKSTYMCIPTGTTFEIKNKFSADGEIRLESGVSIKLNELIIYSGKFTIAAGASVEAAYIKTNSTVDLYGTLKTGKGTTGNSSYIGAPICYHEGALLDMTFSSKTYIDSAARYIEATPVENRFYRHDVHNFSNGVCACGESCPHTNGYVCKDCGQPTTITPDGFILSEGSIGIIIALAVAALGVVVVVVVVTKKKKNPEESVKSGE